MPESTIEPPDGCTGVATARVRVSDSGLNYVQINHRTKINSGSTPPWWMTDTWTMMDPYHKSLPHPTVNKKKKKKQLRECIWEWTLSAASILTQHGQTTNFVHKQCRHNVAGQNSQRPQEVDEVNPVGAVVIIKCHLASCLVVGESAVHHLCAIYQLGFIDVWPKNRKYSLSVITKKKS